MKLIFLLLVTTLTTFAADISPATSFGVGFPRGEQIISSGVPAGQAPVSDGAGGSVYSAVGAGTVNSAAAVGASPNASGLSIVGANINLQPADASFPGVVTTGTQTLAGDKTLNGLILHGADGSVTAPKETWASDPDTGWYRAGSGQINMPLNGSTTSASINRQIKFLDVNALFGGGLGTGIFQDAPGSYYTAGLEGTLPKGIVHTWTGQSGTWFIESGSTAGGPTLSFLRSRGSSPTLNVSVLSGDILGRVQYKGYTTATLQRSGAELRSNATETWSETNRGADWRLETNLTGAAVQTPAIRHDGTGQTIFERASGANLIWNTNGGGTIGLSGGNAPSAIYLTTESVSPLKRAADNAVADASNATALTVRGGDKTAGTGGGGLVTLRGGDTVGGFGGSVQISGRGGATFGGGINMNAGSGGSGAAGDLNFSAGVGGSGNGGGVVNINGGTGGSGSASGGDVSIFAGAGGGAGVGGSVTLRGGAGTGGAALGGNVNIDAGLTGGSGPGKIILKIGTLARWEVRDGGILPVGGTGDIGSHPSNVVGDIYSQSISLYSGGLKLQSAANKRHDSCVLVAGTCTISNTSVEAVGTDSVFCHSQVDGGTPGFLRVSSRTANTSYVVTSSDAGDTSTISCMIVKGF